MDEEHMQEFLQECLELGDELEGGEQQIKSIRTFEKAGFRCNYGLVVKMKDGSEFQVTIVRSK